MIRSWLINMIREKAQKGKSAYAIGKELGISKNTAKKYIEPTKSRTWAQGKKKAIQAGSFQTRDP
ncbi:MAG: hypothetical protein ACOX4S_09105 [Anaerovoracaceae bacterium]|jgi:response regulator of citrate/malate metabolism